jgi:integrase
MKRRGGGSYFKRGAVYWVKYYRNGRPFRESTGSTEERAAKDLLNKRMGAIANGQPIAPKADRIRLDDLLDDLMTEYRVNGRASVGRLEEMVAHLKAFFGGVRASAVDTAQVRQYIAARQEAGAANSTANRELASLKRAYSLAVQAGKLLTRPYIPLLKEDNVRVGFFERDQLEAVLRLLPDAIRPVAIFGAATGWRVSEVLSLTWRQVDFTAGMIRLEPGTTKNLEGRLFPFTPELRALLEAQKAATAALSSKTGRIIPWVFHRHGKPIRSFYGSWRAACRAAGVPGRIFHDLRRTAVRNLERAGVSRSVAMKMTGHKTEAVYRRYAIVSESDLREAAVKLGEAASSRTGTISGTTGTVTRLGTSSASA